MNEQSLNYRIGLDIGIASVGWAVLENGMEDEPRRIVDMGVRIFKKAEMPRTGESLALPRRKARTTRRRLRRRRHRLERIKLLLEKEGIISINKFEERYKSRNFPCVYRLRYEALERKLSNDELAQILLHIAKHRGFKSTRKAEYKDKENGQIINATEENKKLMKEKGYRTVGEMIYKDDAFTTIAPWSESGKIFTPRNKQNDYRHTVLRDLLEDEVTYIFAAQRKFGNVVITEDLEKAYLGIMLGQRSFDMGPGNQANGLPSPYGGNLIEQMVGVCALERGKEKRAAKAAYTSERFVLIQKINHTYLTDEYGKTIGFTKEQREKLINYAYRTKELKYSAVRKYLEIPENLFFKALTYNADKPKDVESAQFVSMQWFYQIQKARGKKHSEIIDEAERELLDEIGTVLTKYKSDDGRRKELLALGVETDIIKNLLKLNPSKFQHLSLKAMKKIMPYLEEGHIYNAACEKAYPDFKADNNTERFELLKGEVLADTMQGILNPVVKRSISQTIKVLNAIIRKYGSPQAVHIELAREMSKNFQERNKIENQQKKNCKDNEEVKKQIMEYGVNNPTGRDILKFRLWQEQNETCLYTGHHIPLERLFHNDYEIDHIIPYSISFDDSYRNKVLVETNANRDKGNRLPAEYFGVDIQKWQKYEILVNTHIRNYRKRLLLLKKEFTMEERMMFKERNLTDTRYITMVVMNVMRKNLVFAPYMNEKKKKKVYAVNGAVTAYLRKRWGLAKDRNTDRHHALDAVVVACCTDGMIQKISKNVQARELAFAHGLQYIDIETGEKLDRGTSREEWDERFGVMLPLPWQYFRKELEIRMSDHPEYFARDLQKWNYPDPDGVKPIFVSHMPNHKITGAEHKETVSSARHFDKQGIVILKTELKNLKLKDGEIEDYYAPQDDRLLYEALKERLKQYEGNKEKQAFDEPFYKPKADGSLGPLVKKVKLAKKQTLGVLLGKNGIAENAEMVRIDVFRENGKYYFVPIYVSDMKKDKLPNRAATAKKAYQEWREMKEENFVFSLYAGDLIRIKRKKAITTKNCDKTSEKRNDILVYYTGANINSAAIHGRSHDGGFEFEGLGIQILEVFEKYQVDVLGNISKVKAERRMHFRH